jgi:hypothetical protein
MSFYIRKSSGEKQRFDLDKFRRSLLKSGATKHLAQIIIEQVQKIRPKSTQELHELATKLLQQHALPVADRYNLKRALMEFGPHGYSFEKFIAHLFSLQGYTTQTGIVVPGFCVDHEVDVVAEKNGDRSIIECKFHNRTGLKSDVKIILYVQARFEDIRDAHQNGHQAFNRAWLVTNTALTTEAIKYGECKKITMISWSYPEQNNLPQLIQYYKLFPITTLTTLNRYQKRLLLQNNLVLCKDIAEQQKTLAQLGLKPKEINKLIRESEDVCQI